MQPPNPGDAAFKRQVVFRISADEWPLLEAAASEHGSIQAAILAGLHALADERASAGDDPAEPPTAEAEREPAAQAEDQAAAEDPDEEIRAREAAEILGLTRGTVAGYIRSGRLAGRHDNTLSGSGWVTTLRAVRAYQRRVQAHR